MKRKPTAFWILAGAMFALGLLACSLALCSLLFHRGFGVAIPGTPLSVGMDRYTVGISHYTEETVTGPPVFPDPVAPYAAANGISTTPPFTRGFHDGDLAATWRSERFGFAIGKSRMLFAIDYDLPVSRNHYQTWRYIRIPNLLSALLLVPFLLLAGRRGRLRRLARVGLCPSCSYDLRAHLPGQNCPECGASIR